MKNNLLSIFSILLCSAVCTANLFAQDDRRAISAASNLYVISAKAGGVNFIEGRVAVTRKNAKSGYLLKGDELEVGDKVATGSDGKAEILLNPGSFARLAADSDFEFATTSLDDLQLKLNAGSAIFEVITDAEFSFSVATPKATFNIIKSGVYRVDVLKNGKSVIEVWKGIARANETEIKSGNQATVKDSEVAVAKFDRDEKDAFEIWSKTRAKELSRINAQLQNAATRMSLMNSFIGSGWSLYDSYGLWIYSPMFGSYCFLPFGYGWNSPYGYHYRRDIWRYNLPPVIYNAPPPIPTVVPTRPPGLASSGMISDRFRNRRTTFENGDGEPVRVVPPYQRIQKGSATFPSLSQSDGYSAPNLSSPGRMSPQMSSPTFGAPPPSSPPSIVSPSTISPKMGGN